MLYLCYTARTMNTDEKILQALEDLRADIKDLQQGQQTLEAGQEALQTEGGKQGERLAALQDDVTAIKTETAKIPGIEQRLEHHSKLLTGLTATMATVLEEQQAQRSDIRSLHTEVHASKEELKGEILSARAEARADSMDVKATAMRHFKGHEQRIDALEDAVDIPHPDKH
jgi:chromosome segregation ATPase